MTTGPTLADGSGSSPQPTLLVAASESTGKQGDEHLYLAMGKIPCSPFIVHFWVIVSIACKATISSAVSLAITYAAAAVILCLLWGGVYRSSAMYTYPRLEPSTCSSLCERYIHVGRSTPDTTGMRELFGRCCPPSLMPHMKLYDVSSTSMG